MSRILIIEDDISFTHILEKFLRKNTFGTSTASTLKNGLQLLDEEGFDLVLLDYRLPDGTGMDMLTRYASRKGAVPVVIMTSFHDIRTAVKAIRHGAYDFITKPVNPEELLMIIQEAIQARNAASGALQESALMVEGHSEAAQKIKEHIMLVAPTDLNILITGESGTGKELVARMIHQYSARNGDVFIAIDCGTLSAELAASEIFGHVKGSFTGATQDKKGKFEIANSGTLFLDEVGNLSYEVQVKLLRALQEKEIQPLGSNKVIRTNARIITATNEDLRQAVHNGTFREDLYHRLNEFKIQLPALSERKEDFRLFVDHFIQLANKELGKNITGLSEEVSQLFQRYTWPGNLRELKNILKRAVLLTKTELITLDALPDEMMLAIEMQGEEEDKDLKSVRELSEKELIIKTLQEVKYNKSKAARLLQIDRTTLYYKMAKYGIDG